MCQGQAWNLYQEKVVRSGGKGVEGINHLKDAFEFELWKNHEESLEKLRKEEHKHVCTLKKYL